MCARTMGMHGLRVQSLTKCGGLIAYKKARKLTHAHRLQRSLAHTQEQQRAELLRGRHQHTERRLQRERQLVVQHRLQPGHDTKQIALHLRLPHAHVSAYTAQVLTVFGSTYILFAPTLQQRAHCEAALRGCEQERAAEQGRVHAAADEPRPVWMSPLITH